MSKEFSRGLFLVSFMVTLTLLFIVALAYTTKQDRIKPEYKQHIIWS